MDFPFWFSDYWFIRVLLNIRNEKSVIISLRADLCDDGENFCIFNTPNLSQDVATFPTKK